MQLRNANWSVGRRFIHPGHTCCLLSGKLSSLQQSPQAQLPILVHLFHFCFLCFSSSCILFLTRKWSVFYNFFFYAKRAGPYLYLNTSKMIHTKKTNKKMFNIWTFFLFSKFVTEFLGWKRMFNNWTFFFTTCYFVAHKKKRLFNNWTFLFASTKGLIVL